MTALRFGILSGVLASLCCIGPLVLLALGLGSLGLGTVLGRYHWWFISAAAILFGTGWWKYVKERRRCRTEQCQMVRGTTTKWTLIAATGFVLIFNSMNLWASFTTPLSSEASLPKRGGIMVHIAVKGMTCATCELTIEHSLSKLPGVASVDAQVRQERVLVSYNPKLVTTEQLVEAINKTGFRVQLPESAGQP